MWRGVGGFTYFGGSTSLTELSCIARKLNVPIYSLLGGKVRDKIQVYAWIGGDRPKDVEIQA